MTQKFLKKKECVPDSILCIWEAEQEQDLQAGGPGLTLSPPRGSCDVRGRCSLWSSVSFALLGSVWGGRGRTLEGGGHPGGLSA